MAILDDAAGDLRADHDEAGLHLFLLAKPTAFMAAPMMRIAYEAYSAIRPKRSIWST